MRLAIGALSVFVIGIAPAISQGAAPQSDNAANLADAFRTQVMKCWNPQVNALHPEDLVVDFDLFLNEDGSVVRLPQLVGNSRTAAASNRYTNAAAAAAMRAILTCAPYKLPPDRYNEWREINPLHFDPRQMVEY